MTDRRFKIRAEARHAGYRITSVYLVTANSLDSESREGGREGGVNALPRKTVRATPWNSLKLVISFSHPHPLRGGREGEEENGLRGCMEKEEVGV